MVIELENRARQVLRGWQLGIVSSDEVRAWTDARLLESITPRDLPEWFLTLAERGPGVCVRMPTADFSFDWAPLPFLDEFLARVHELDLRDTSCVWKFVDWISNAAMGEDRDDPAVQLGYYVESFTYEQDRRSHAAAVAIEVARAQLRDFQREASAFVATIRAELGSFGRAG